ncbi:MAG: PilZ domain-containing protein [Desulfobacterales bacterium]|nr:PilZ domain-containing protein [Desulfobacterales bacterium]
MYPLTVIIKKDRTVDISCPRCRGTRTVPVAEFRDLHLDKTVRCNCATIFKVRLEARGLFRRETMLKGGYTNLTVEQPRAPMLVTNISLQGIGFMDCSDQPLGIDDRLRVAFVLDDPRGTLIRTEARVVSTRGRDIGCEFINNEEYAKQLAGYILS